MKKLVTVVFLSMLMVGCGDGGDSSPQNNDSQRASSKTQLSVDAADLQALQNVKYASNDGIAFSTPENFQK
jgi:PBP1b-binding outer membrane lipoprotein LpoB